MAPRLPDRLYPQEEENERKQFIAVCRALALLASHPSDADARVNRCCVGLPPLRCRAPTAAAKPFRIAVIMPSATTDMAFSQSMCGALQTVQKDMGGESALEIAYTENMFNVPDAAAAIRDYASQGFDIVIAHGSQYGSSVQEIAPDFPKTTFAWGTDVNTFGLPNVYAYTAAAEQGGYVNGVLAAKLTKSKKIGVTGPVEVGDAKTYIDGFIQGVASVDPTITGHQDLDRLVLGRGPDDRRRPRPTSPAAPTS